MAPSDLRERANTQRALGDKYQSAEKIPSLLLSSLILSLPALPKEAKMESQRSKQPSNKQVYDTCKEDTSTSQTNWQISAFPHKTPPEKNIKTKRVFKKKASQWTIHTTKRSPSISLGLKRNQQSSLVTQSHFPSRATTQRQLCPLIQVWCREGKEGGGRTIDGLFTGLPMLTWITGGGKPEGSERGGGRRVSKLRLRTIVSLCLVNTECIILSSSSQLTAGTEKQHLKVAAGE